MTLKVTGKPVFTNASSLYSITLTVTDGVDPVSDAAVQVNGQTLNTNSSGVAVFTGFANASYVYGVSKSGYDNASGFVTVNSGNVSESVTLTES